MGEEEDVLNITRRIKGGVVHYQYAHVRIHKTYVCITHTHMHGIHSERVETTGDALCGPRSRHMPTVFFI